MVMVALVFWLTV